MALDTYLEFVSRRKWVLLAPLILAAIGAIAVTLWMPRVYAASATVRIAVAGTAASQPVAPDHAERLINTYVQIPQSSPVLSRVITQLGLGASPDELQRRIDVEALPNTELIRITVEAESPAEARDVANALGAALVQEGQEFYAESASSSLADSFSVMENAILPEDPVRPSWPLNMAIGLLVGLAAGVGLSLALEYTDRTLRGVKDLGSITPLPVLSSIPRVRMPATNGAVSSVELVRSQASEEWQEQPVFSLLAEYRLLASTLRELVDDQGLRSVLVTTAWREEGATSVVVGASVALAHSGMKILLVDANLHNPLLHSVFKLPSRPGLRNVLVTSANGSRDLQKSLAKAVRPSSVSGLSVLTSGSTIGDPSELLVSAKMRKLIELFEKEPIVTIIDAPPLLQSGDTAVLAHSVDGVVVVCAEGEATTDSVRRTLEHLENVGANVLGLVYNKALQ